MAPKLIISIAAFAALSLSPAFAQDAQNAPAAPMAHHWQKPSPDQMAAWHKQMCGDRYAHVAGRLAFVEARLDINDSQRPLFDRWRDVVLHEAKAREDSCFARQHAPGEHPTILERNAMMQKRLENRLAALRSEEPALDAFYQSLSPEQKTEFDHQHRGHGFGHHRGGMMMRHGDEAHG